MRLSIGRRQFLAAAALAGISATGCGTILYPERRGQRAGRLDWGVVLLDGIGLILFFVPGVIAFAVDFASGAIYLPAEPQVQLSSAERSQGFKSLQVQTHPLSRAEIAKAVSAQTGQPIGLEEGQYFTAELRDLDGFWSARDRLAATCQKNRSAELPIPRAS
jgi:hypothetical protein